MKEYENWPRLSGYEDHELKTTIVCNYGFSPECVRSWVIATMIRLPKGQIPNTPVVITSVCSACKPRFNNLFGDEN
jgi:hypothetical protein